MRRITKISIDNFRAYIHPLVFSLPRGEDLLIYGENGSGKSSLYKALRFFLESSINSSRPLEVNYFSGRPVGSISVTYSDVDAAGSVIDGTEQTYTISSDSTQTNNAQPFIKTSFRASGFLDYTQLLKVYLDNGVRPNLFSLITGLLGNYVPNGYTRTIKEFLSVIENDLHAGYHRTDLIHQRGLAEFGQFEVLFPQLIDKLNAVLKPMMSRYFKGIGIEIELVGAKANLYDPGTIGNMRVTGTVFFDVKHNGSNLPNYNDRLNEARLSAIATCLYLSSLKLIAKTNDTRVLFLDDVFIGLDLGNRLPVLAIVQKEFKEYQRIITTYDKSWFIHAKEALSEDGCWKFFEMYEGEFQDVAGNRLFRPILVETEPPYGRACSFLNDPDHPDYPASANYLRKSFEELLLCDLYDKAVRDENYEEIPAHRLTHLVAACRDFVAKLPDYIVSQVTTSLLLADLAGLLHPLLHPLSHYAPDTPTYKAELKTAMNIYEGLKQEFQQSDYSSHCRVIIEKGKKIEFVVKGVSGWEYHYVFKLKDNLYRYDNNVGGKSLSLCKMRVVSMHWSGSSGSGKMSIGQDNKVGDSMTYYSMQECHNKILHYIQTVEKKADIVMQPFDEMFFVPDVTNTMQSMKLVLSSV